MSKVVFTLDEVAKLLRVNPRTIFRLIHGQNQEGKKLPATKVGRAWRITEDNLKTFLLENANIANEIEFEAMISSSKKTKSQRRKQQ